jgi:cyclic pyranopterin monophosphate synthase
MSKLSHFNPGGEAHMVDIGAKPVTRRVALAEGRILMQAETLCVIEAGAHRKGMSFASRA